MSTETQGSNSTPPPDAERQARQPDAAAQPPQRAGAQSQPESGGVRPPAPQPYRPPTAAKPPRPYSEVVGAKPRQHDGARADAKPSQPDVERANAKPPQPDGERADAKPPQPDVERVAERLARTDNVRRAIEQTSPKRADVPAAPASKPRWSWGIVAYGAALLVLATAQHYAAALGSYGRHWLLLSNFTQGAVGVTMVLVAARLVDRAVLQRIQDPVAQYNLRRIVSLAAGAGCVVLVLSLLLVNWYAGIVSVGVVSLVISLSLQPTITSFIGWIYLLVRAPYRVGDRIQIGDAQGDVIDVGYLDTTLWEFGGPYLSTDHPSGRIIRFPNSGVLQSRVINYSWPLFPYIWNEIKLSIGYDSDLEFVEKTMRDIVTEDIGEEMMRRVRVYRQLLAETPVDELTVQESPSVVFRVNSNTWIDAIVRYVVDPRTQGRVKNRLIKKLLAALNAHPDRVRFPKGDSR